MPPWIIDELEEERRRRENDASQVVRIELPQSPLDDSEEARPRQGGVRIVDISPADDNVIDL